MFSSHLTGVCLSPNFSVSDPFHREGSQLFGFLAFLATTFSIHQSCQVRICLPGWWMKFLCISCNLLRNRVCVVSDLFMITVPSFSWFCDGSALDQLVPFTSPSQNFLGGTSSLTKWADFHFHQLLALWFGYSVCYIVVGFRDLLPLRVLGSINWHVIGAGKAPV